MLSVQVLNTTGQAIDYALQIGVQYAEVTITANSLQTLLVPLRRDVAIEH
jgi:hypothetical protein